MFFSFILNTKFVKNAELFPAGVWTREITPKCWGEIFFDNLRILFSRRTAFWMNFNYFFFLLFFLQQQEQLMYGEEGTCTLCSKTFARKSSLLTHIRNHTAERKYHCPTCQKSKPNLRTFQWNWLIILHFLNNCHTFSPSSFHTSGQSTKSWTNPLASPVSIFIIIQYRMSFLKSSLEFSWQAVRVRRLWKGLHPNHKFKCKRKSISFVMMTVNNFD